MSVQPWKILRSQFVLDNPWCRVRQDEVQLPNGRVVPDFFINVRPDIATVFPLTATGEVVMVRQYRHGVGKILLELPAGTFQRDRESAEVAARRELLEETGYTGDRFVHLATLHNSPVKDTSDVHLFLAPSVQWVAEPKTDVTEEIEVVLMPLERLKPAILSGEICVAGSISAIFFALEYLSQGER